MCQMLLHHVNWEFLSNLSKIPNLHGEKHLTHEILYVKENLVA